MTESNGKTRLTIICPYCKENFKKEAEVMKKNGLFSILIKSHPNGEDCPPFVAFIDDNMMHRGSQKIDKSEEETSLNEGVLEAARKRINELKEAVRFYHLKLRKDGRWYENKIASVKDRSFMSSKIYMGVIAFLGYSKEENVFGVVEVEQGPDFEGGLLVYGKYHDMIYTIFWKDQKSLKGKTIDDLKGDANLTIEKLVDIHNLYEFFF